jgi:small-conductance mechanosensitive channel
MNTLERATPRTGIAIAPRSRTFPGSSSFAPARPSLSVVKQRRRNVLLSMVGATGVLLVGSMAAGGLLTTLFVLALVLTGAYVVMLANAQKRVLERRTKVRHLPTAGRVATAQVDFFAEDRSGEVAFDAAPRIRAVGSR